MKFSKYLILILISVLLVQITFQRKSSRKSDIKDDGTDELKEKDPGQDQQKEQQKRRHERLIKMRKERQEDDELRRQEKEEPLEDDFKFSRESRKELREEQRKIRRQEELKKDEIRKKKKDELKQKYQFNEEFQTLTDKELQEEIIKLHKKDSGLQEKRKKLMEEQRKRQDFERGIDPELEQKRREQHQQNNNHHNHHHNWHQQHNIDHDEDCEWRNPEANKIKKKFEHIIWTNSHPFQSHWIMNVANYAPDGKLVDDQLRQFASHVNMNIDILADKHKVDLSKEEVYTGFITWTHKIKEWNTRILDKWQGYMAVRPKDGRKKKVENTEGLKEGEKSDL